MVLPAGDGGAPSTTGGFHVISQRPDLLVRSASDVVDAVTITAEDDVFLVIFSFTISRQEWQGIGTQVAAADRALWIQTMAMHEHVVAMTYSQDVNAAGTLRDVMVMTVGTPDGNHAADVAWPLTSLNTPGAFQAVDNAYATLVKTAGLT